MKSPLTTYRKQKALTLQGFGRKLGVNASTVMRWEARGIPVERLTKVAKLTGIPPVKLRPDLAFIISNSGSRASSPRPAPLGAGLLPSLGPAPLITKRPK